MEINVPEIMNKIRITAEIRREIDDKGLKSDILPFDKILDINFSTRKKFEYSELAELVNTCNKIYSVSAWRPLSGNPIKVFVKKVIRKCCKFYIEPITAEQTDFNAVAVRVINLVNMYIKEFDINSVLSYFDGRIAAIEYKATSGNKDTDVNIESEEALSDISADSFLVPDIMRRIRQNNRLMNSSTLSQKSFDTNELDTQLNILNRIYIIQSEHEIHGKFKFIKKTIRKFLRFYIEPIVRTQNEYNMILVKVLNAIRSYIVTSEFNKTKFDKLYERMNKLERL